MPSDKDRPLAVVVPQAADDRPRWGKVGILAVGGFVVGVAWPPLTGVKLGPAAPGESAAALAAAASAAAAPRASESPPTAPASAPAAALAVPAPSAAPAAAGPPNVAVGRGAVVSCKNEDGETLKGKECGGLSGFDAVALPRIRRVHDCSAAEGATGKLSMVFGVDFANNRINVEIGKSSSVPNLESVGACVKQQFSGVSLGPMDHEHPRYTLAYSATLSLAEAGGAAAPGPSGAPASSGPPVAMDAPTASVVWEVAIVRDAPKTGQVVARLQRGTKVRVGQGQENWYRVRYGASFATDGWVYRGSIGR